MNKIIPSLFLVFLSTITFSQVIKSDESTNSNQPKVIVFRPDGEDDSSNKEPEFKHMIKISPIMFLNGDFPIFYERRMGTNFSFELGLGMTHRDYISNLYDEMNDNSFSYDDVTEYQFGKSLRMGLKYWPSKYGALDEGYYFSPEFLYRQYNSSITFTDYDSNIFENSETTYDRERTVKEFRMLIGWVYYLDDNVFFEYFAGVGLASIDNKYTMRPSGMPEVENKSRPNYIFGWKLGFSL